MNCINSAPMCEIINCIEKKSLWFLFSSPKDPSIRTLGGYGLRPTLVVRWGGPSRALNLEERSRSQEPRIERRFTNLGLRIKKVMIGSPHSWETSKVERRWSHYFVTGLYSTMNWIHLKKRFLFSLWWV